MSLFQAMQCKARAVFNSPDRIWYYTFLLSVRTHFIYLYIYTLARVPGIAWHDQSQNLMDGVIFQDKEEGLQNLWKGVSVE
jgi:hypothetical protein